MGVQYQLVNLDRREYISFDKVNTGTKLRELAGTPVVGHIIAWYLLEHIGQRISFIEDKSESFSLFGNQYRQSDFHNYSDVTETVIQQLIQAGILQDKGRLWIDQTENLYFRDLRNIWLEQSDK